MNNSNYYLVWEESTGYTKYKHSNFESALSESKRLANAHPDKDFIILKPIVKSRKVSVFTEKIGDLNCNESYHMQTEKSL